jgi:hypothetical protein
VGAPAKPHKLGAELVTYRVLEDPASLAPARGGGARHGVRGILRVRIQCAISH